jgi:hypothetical protein
MLWSTFIVLIAIWTRWCCTAIQDDYENNEEYLLKRNKRFLWMTHERRLVMPPGTQLVLTPTLAMPLLRYPPTGLDANLTISTPFTSNIFCVTKKN